MTERRKGRSDAQHGNLEQEILWRTDRRMIGQTVAGRGKDD
jgi:hypothetical protein